VRCVLRQLSVGAVEAQQVPKVQGTEWAMYRNVSVKINKKERGRTNARDEVPLTLCKVEVIAIMGSGRKGEQAAVGS
jgi:hypothetical protein